MFIQYMFLYNFEWDVVNPFYEKVQNKTSSKSVIEMEISDNFFSEI